MFYIMFYKKKFQLKIDYLENDIFSNKILFYISK